MSLFVPSSHDFFGQLLVSFNAFHSTLFLFFSMRPSVRDHDSSIFFRAFVFGGPYPGVFLVFPFLTSPQIPPFLSFIISYKKLFSDCSGPPISFTGFDLFRVPPVPGLVNFPNLSSQQFPGNSFLTLPQFNPFPCSQSPIERLRWPSPLKQKQFFGSSMLLHQLPRQPSRLFTWFFTLHFFWTRRSSSPLSEHFNSEIFHPLAQAPACSFFATLKFSPGWFSVHDSHLQLSAVWRALG